MLNKGRQEDYKDQKILASFGAWQIVETVKALMLGNDNKSLDFLSYGEKLGLFEEKENSLDPNRLEKEKEQALKIADEILQLDRGQKE
jgi:hypothetical protein